MLLIGNGNLITQNEKKPFIKDGCVAVDGMVITDFGATKEMRQKYAGSQFEDVCGKVIMPGLINAHMHIYSAFARGMNLINAPVSKNFKQILENLWWRLDKVINLEDVKYSAYTTYIDCIKNGVTTVFDHHASQHFVKDSLFTIAEVAKELGIRTSLCYEVSDRDGPEICSQAIRENVDFIRFADTQGDNMLKGMFGLHASLTLSDKTLSECVAAMGSLNAGFHIHTAEGIADVHDSLRQYGKRVVNRLFEAGILGEKTIAVHCVHINPAEVELLAETNSMVVHNPESNMGNAVGCAAIMPLVSRGVMLGLGTDGYTSDMFESMKAANVLHKHQLCDPSVAWGEVPQMLFQNNRQIAERFFKGELGVIEKGAQADIIVVDYEPPTPISGDNTNSHILFGMMGRSVDSTMINGEFVYKNRRLLRVCEKEIYSKSRETAELFWERINK